MTLKQLEAFYWAARLGSFAIAARRLHITQSSLSKRIAELESGLGVPLFDRSARRAVPTEAGERVQAVARRMLELGDELRDATRTGPAIGETCRLGISELSAATWFPRFAARVQREHPRLSLHPHVALTHELESRVERGELDFTVAAGTPRSTALAYRPLASVQFAWVAAPDRLRAGRALDAAALRAHPVIAQSGESGLMRAIERWLLDNGFEATTFLSCNSLTAITALTAAGVGVSVLPRGYARPLVAAGRLVELRSAARLPSLDYVLAWRRDDPRALIARMAELVVAEADFGVPSPLWVARPRRAARAAAAVSGAR